MRTLFDEFSDPRDPLEMPRPDGAAAGRRLSRTMTDRAIKRTKPEYRDRNADEQAQVDAMLADRRLVTVCPAAHAIGLTRYEEQTGRALYDGTDDGSKQRAAVASRKRGVANAIRANLIRKNGKHRESQ